jgi:hypothetical protein
LLLRPAAAVLTLALLFAVLAAALAPTAGPSAGEPRGPRASAEDPASLRRRALDDLNRTLDARSEVVLIDGDGRERWYRWATEKDRPPLRPTFPGWRSLKAIDQLCQCELLPDPRGEQYLFSAEVQVPQRLPLGHAGLYLLGEECDTPDGKMYRYLSLQLAEQQSGAKAALRFRLEHYLVPRPGRPSVIDRNYLAVQTLPAASLQEWHTLGVRVSAEGLTVLYDGAAVKTIPHEALDRQVAAWEKRLAPLAFKPLNRRGSLGVLVSDADARFRNVVLKPLPAR